MHMAGDGPFEILSAVQSWTHDYTSFQLEKITTTYAGQGMATEMEVLQRCTKI